MQKFVSITSQGQITIPAAIRRLLGLDKYPRALVRAEDKRIIIEPAPDLLKLEGALQEKAIKGKRIQEIIDLEERAISQLISQKNK